MQKDFADDLMEQFKTDQYRLLIVDSVMACFRIDYTGRAELSERQQELGRFLNKVMMLSEEFNICVLMVCCPFSPLSFLPSAILPCHAQSTDLRSHLFIHPPFLQEKMAVKLTSPIPDKPSPIRPRSQRAFRWR